MPIAEISGTRRGHAQRPIRDARSTAKPYRPVTITDTISAAPSTSGSG